MKAAVVYYSMSGNAAYAAEKVAGELGADLVELIPETAYPDSGFKKFLWGGKSALMGEQPKLKHYTFDGAQYDTVIFVFPVWASSFTPPIKSFIAENAAALDGKRMAAIACYMGSGGEKAIEKLRKELNISDFTAKLVLIDPKNKPSAEKEEKLHAFCGALR